MTGRNTSSPDSVLHLLKEAGVDEDPALLEAVGQIAELAERPAPEPSAMPTMPARGRTRALELDEIPSLLEDHLRRCLEVAPRHGAAAPTTVTWVPQVHSPPPF